MLDTIYIVRHGFRMPWRGNELNLSPTGRPRDPVLTAHGIDQVKLLGDYFLSLPEEQRPQMIISSPYYRCVQTAGPSAEKLDMEIHIEPGLAEWFPPSVRGSGSQPVPMRAATASQYSPRVASKEKWSPMLYPSRKGESIRQLHYRAREVVRRIAQRCEQRGVQRVLLVSHAATIIALGRILQEDVGRETTDWQTGAGLEIGAGTCCLSLYAREEQARRVFGLEPSGINRNSDWTQLKNGSADFLPKGVEREWTFRDITGNEEEHGMGEGWHDEEALDEDEMAKLEYVAVEATPASQPQSRL